MPASWRRWAREPLVHFLVLGALLFVAFAIFSPAGGAAGHRIVVDEALVDHLADTFALTWQRPPTSDELRALIDDHVKEEIFYREALALGLDKDDVVVRRRLRQKMEFLSEDVAMMAEPTDADLAGYFAAHRKEFEVAASLSFRHVFFSSERRGASAEADATRTLERLRELDRAGDSVKDTSELGDAFLLPTQFDHVTEGDVAKQLGAEFAAALTKAPSDEWSGPIRSEYGIHLVRVAERTAAREPSLEEVREAVEREWRAAERRKANDEFYAKLRERYAVAIDVPPDKYAATPSSRR